jgi:hypothetical protein
MINIEEKMSVRNVLIKLSYRFPYPLFKGDLFAGEIS